MFVFAADAAADKVPKWKSRWSCWTEHCWFYFSFDICISVYALLLFLCLLFIFAADATGRDVWPTGWARRSWWRWWFLLFDWILNSHLCVSVCFLSVLVFDLQQRREISFIRRVSCRAHIRWSHHHWLYFLNKVPHINVLPSRQVNVPHQDFHSKILSKPTTKRDEGVERVGRKLKVSTLSIHTVWRNRCLIGPDFVVTSRWKTSWNLILVDLSCEKNNLIS